MQLVEAAKYGRADNVIALMAEGSDIECKDYVRIGVLRCKMLCNFVTLTYALMYSEVCSAGDYLLLYLIMVSCVWFLS